VSKINNLHHVQVVSSVCVSKL